MENNVIDKIRSWLNRNFSAPTAAFNRFMTGRNGLDNLGRATAWLYIILCCVRMFCAILRVRFLIGPLGLILNILLIFFLFRMFSKNLYKRQEENGKWLKFSAQWTNRLRRLPIQRYLLRVTDFFSGVIRKIKFFFTRLKDREHKYFTCKSCGTVCRVPRGKGKIMITCPRCGNQIQGKS